MDTKNNPILRNQSGAALIVALIMMVVLTLIGLASIFTSTFEIKISGNKRGSTDAFYAADSGAQVVTANAQNFSSTHSSPYNPFADAANPNPTNPTNAQASVTCVGTQQGAPRGYGVSATQFQFEYFLLSSTGQDQTDTSVVPSTCTVQEKVVRLIPTLQGGY
jgi:Tfp pilus assembly protein PilX